MPHLHEGMECSPVEGAFFAFASFLSTVLLTVTGFGNAIVFQLLYALANAAAAIPCATIKESVFLQTIAATATIPLILYMSRGTFQRDLDPLLVLLLLPTMAVGSFMGLWSQALLSVPWLEVICGAFLVIFALNSLRTNTYLLGEVWKKMSRLSCRSAGDREESELAEVEYSELIYHPSPAERQKQLVDETPQPAADSTGRHHRGKEKHPIQINKTSISHLGTSPSCDIATADGAKFAQPTDTVGESGLCSVPSEQEVPHALDSVPVDIGGEKELELHSGQTDDSKTWRSRLGRICQEASPRIVIGGITAGTLGGVLGGLTGIRGPPVLIFLVYSGHRKDVIRCVSLFMGVASLSSRMWVYATSQGPGDGPGSKWFNIDDGWLYLAVLLSGVSGIPVGHLLYGKMDLEIFKALLSCILVLSGIALLIPGITGVMSN